MQKNSCVLLLEAALAEPFAFLIGLSLHRLFCSLLSFPFLLFCLLFRQIFQLLQHRRYFFFRFNKFAFNRNEASRNFSIKKRRDVEQLVHVTEQSAPLYLVTARDTKARET